MCNFPNLFHEVNILLKAKLGKVITRKIQNNMPYEYGHCQRERKQCPLLFQVLLAHLRIEFTRERLKGESQKEKVKSLITCVLRRDLKKLSNVPKWAKPLTIFS